MPITMTEPITDIHHHHHHHHSSSSSSIKPWRLLSGYTDECINGGKMGVVADYVLKPSCC